MTTTIGSFDVLNVRFYGTIVHCTYKKSNGVVSSSCFSFPNLDLVNRFKSKIGGKNIKFAQSLLRKGCKVKLCYEIGKCRVTGFTLWYGNKPHKLTATFPGVGEGLFA